MTEDVQSIFDQALTASRQKDLASARLLLKQLFKQDPRHINGWLLAAHIVESRSDEIQCYKRILQIDPNHAYARQKLSQLEGEQPVTPSIDLSNLRSTPAPTPTGMTLSSNLPATPQPTPIQPLVQSSLEMRPQSMDVQKPDSNSTMKAGIYTAVGLLVVALLCLIVLAIGNFARTGGLLAFATPVPTPTSKQLFNVFYQNARAGEAEDINAYMATIHPDSFMYNSTKSLLPPIFSEYDLTYQFYNLRVISADANEAVVHFSLVTRKRSGPAFRNNIVSGKMTLRPDKGVWKMYYQEVEKTSFEN